MPRVSRIRPEGPQEPRQRVQPVQARSRQKIDAILDATARLLATHGVDAISTSAIAEEAGVPAPTVYHYFENRLAVFAALARRVIDDVDAALIPLIQAQMAQPQPNIRLTLQGLFDAYAKSPEYAAVLSTLRAEPALQEIVKQSNERVAAVIAAMLSSRSGLPAARAKRVGWIVAESCDAVLQRALLAGKSEAKALFEELIVVIECLFAHYSTIGAAKPVLPAPARKKAAAPRRARARKP